MRIYIFVKEPGERQESETFSFFSTDLIQFQARNLKILNKLRTCNTNVRNKGKAFHCRMIFPLEFEVGASGTVKFYQFKM